MEDDEEGGEDCPVELVLNRHGDDAYQIVMMMVILVTWLNRRRFGRPLSTRP